MQGRRSDLPPLEFLVAFEAAARLSSFTAAGDELHLTQAAVSRQIRLLEENLGVRLFARGHRSVSLTPEGRTFQHTVAMALTHVANAARDLRPTIDRPHVTLAADQSISALWLLPRLDAFRRDHPAITIRLVSSDVEAECLAQDIDIAIIHGDGAWTGFEAECLFREEVYPVCSPGYLDETAPVSAPADLVDHALIELEDDHWAWMNWRVWLTENGVDLPKDRHALMINSYPLVVQAACDGLGVALGWRHLVDDYIERGVLVRPLAASVATDYGYYLLTPASRAPSPETVVLKQSLTGKVST